MQAADKIYRYFDSLPDPKSSDRRYLHAAVLELAPGCRLWFVDGKDESGKVVSNPSIGYGVRNMKYADGRSREFHQAGISANSSGITVYIMGLDDRKYLSGKYAASIGKASATGYRIKFKSLKDVDLEVLKDAARDGIERTRA